MALELNVQLLLKIVTGFAFEMHCLAVHVKAWRGWFQEFWALRESQRKFSIPAAPLTRWGWGELSPAAWTRWWVYGEFLIWKQEKASQTKNKAASLSAHGLFVKKSESFEVKINL